MSSRGKHRRPNTHPSTPLHAIAEESEGLGKLLCVLEQEEEVLHNDTTNYVTEVEHQNMNPKVVQWLTGQNSDTLAANQREQGTRLEKRVQKLKQLYAVFDSLTEQAKAFDNALASLKWKLCIARCERQALRKQLHAETRQELRKQLYAKVREELRRQLPAKVQLAHLCADFDAFDKALVCMQSQLSIALRKREELKETIIRSRDLDRQKKIFLAWSSIAGDEWAF